LIFLFYKNNIIKIYIIYILIASTHTQSSHTQSSQNNNYIAYYFIKNHPELRLYLISINGSIYSNITNKFIEPIIYNGYQIIYLENRRYLVHNLMAETFLSDNKNILMDDVVHIDGNKLNNHKDNLRWKEKEVESSSPYMDKYHRLFECIIV